MIWGVVVTVFVSVLLTGVLAKIGPIDAPRDRGLSSWPTATTGGLAVIAATLLGVIIFGALTAPMPGLDGVAWLLAGAVVLGLMGAVDDVVDFPAVPKLAAQVIVSLAFSALVARVQLLTFAPAVTVDLGLILGVLGTTLWLVAVINAYNFMDGSDGLAVGVQSIGLFTLALANPTRPLLAFALLAAAVANLAFLPFNHPGRRIFQGDCGALFSSFLIAGATVLLATGDDPASSIYLGVFVAAPFLVDVFLTLARRARAGQSLLQAHAEHLYQRWVRSGGHSPGALAWRVWGLSAACAVIGLFVEQLYPDWSFAVLTLLLLVLGGAWTWMSRQLDQMDAITAVTTSD